MKKTLTLLALVLITFGAFAQRDADLKLDTIYSPNQVQSTPNDQTVFDMELGITNFGPDIMTTGDSILWSFMPYQVVVNNGQAQLQALLNNPLVGIDILTEDFAVNSEYKLTASFTINGTIFQSFNAAGIAEIIPLNRPNLLRDTGASRETNRAIKLFPWLHQNGSSVSVSNVSYDGNIKAYPNPSTSTLNVALVYANVAASTVELYDLSGKLVYTSPMASSFGEGTHRMDVSSFQNGLYILKVNNGETTSTTKVSISH